MTPYITKPCPGIDWGEVIFLFSFLQSILSNLLFYTLHLKGNSTFLKPLTAAQEREYLREFHEEGNQASRSALIEHNLRLVAHIVKKYYAACDDQEDLISIGTIGLIKGVDTFHPEKGTRLATYAARCIENEILMYFRAQRKNAGTVSLSEPIETDGDGDPLTLIDLIFEEDTVSDEIDLKNKVRTLYTLLEQMPEGREKEILILRYGLYRKEPLTQREIAKKLGISRSYVSRIEKKAVEWLAKAFNS